jgi:hypothetical protein
MCGSFHTAVLDFIVLVGSFQKSKHELQTKLGKVRGKFEETIGN